MLNMLRKEIGKRKNCGIEIYIFLSSLLCINNRINLFRFIKGKY